MNKIVGLIVSLIIGIIIGFVLFTFTPIGIRYELISIPPYELFYRIDKWTGKTQYCYFAPTSDRPIKFSCYNIDAF